MEVRELEWFVTLAKTENVTNAAQLLTISQPTLSRALARLERRVGVQLFDRHQNRLRLNKYGEMFQAHAIRALAELTAGEERIRHLLDPDGGTISIGFQPSFGDWLIPSILHRFHATAPGANLELEAASLDVIVHSVREGRLHMGFVGPEPHAGDLLWVPLGRERLCVEVSRGHPLEERTSVTVSEIAGHPMLALGHGSELRSVVDQLFADMDLVPRLLVEATELSTLRALVRHGGGMAIIPKPLGPTEPLTTVIPLEGPGAYRPYGVVARRGGPDSRVARALLSFVSAVPSTELESQLS